MFKISQLLVTVGLTMLCAMTAPLAAHADATTMTINITTPLNSTATDCTSSETITVTGDVHSVIHSTTDGAGGIHAESHVNNQNVSGVGQVTGTQYRFVASNTLLSYNSTAGGGSEYTSNIEVRMIGQGPNNNQIFRALYHITVSASGQVSQTYDFTNWTCQ